MLVAFILCACGHEHRDLFNHYLQKEVCFSCPWLYLTWLQDMVLMSNVYIGIPRKVSSSLAVRIINSQWNCGTRRQASHLQHCMYSYFSVLTYYFTKSRHPKLVVFKVHRITFISDYNIAQVIFRIYFSAKWNSITKTLFTVS
jgi:hypothetical protein